MTETDVPKYYKPITCLSSTYKLIAPLLTKCTYTFLDENNIVPLKQKVCRRGSYGCKDQLMINNIFLENKRKKGKNLNIAWMDCRKVFTSVPYSCIIKAL